MSRLFVFCILFVCLFYVIQASPLPDGDKPPEGDKAPQNSGVGESMKDYIQNLKESPALQEAYENTKKFLNSAADTLQKEFEKISDKIRE